MGAYRSSDDLGSTAASGGLAADDASDLPGSSTSSPTGGATLDDPYGITRSRTGTGRHSSLSGSRTRSTS
jgi:hypothetical protein